MNDQQGECRPMQEPANTYGLTNAPQLQEPIRENKARLINIRELSHGYIVEVGCQSFAIENQHKLLALLGEYLRNPNETEKKYNEGKLFV